MDEDERLRIFNEQHDKIYTTPPIENFKNQGTPGRGPSEVTPEQQAVLRQVEANTVANNPGVVVNPQHAPTTAPPVYSTPAGVSQPVTRDVCPQCNTIHPPIRSGELCPNAKMNLPSIKDEEIGDFLVSMRNIIISQVEKKQVKNVKKLFQQSIVVLAKFLEEYKEEEENVESNPTITKPEKTPSIH